MPHEIPAGTELMMPSPLPVGLTVRRTIVAKRAFIVVFAFAVIVHDAVPVHGPSIQPMNMDVGPATAVNVTAVPAGMVIVHCAPQSRPLGNDVTTPPPSPLFMMVSVTMVSVSLVSGPPPTSNPGDASWFSAGDASWYGDGCLLQAVMSAITHSADTAAALIARSRCDEKRVSRSEER